MSRTVHEAAGAFWAKVDMSGGPDACWPWIAAARTSRRRTRPGYGEFMAEGKVLLSHRVAYTLAVGPIPAGAFILHSCDNGLCCNPAHLRPGTARENTRDMMERGRNRAPRKVRCVRCHLLDETRVPRSDGKSHCGLCVRARRADAWRALTPEQRDARRRSRRKAAA